jgi:hypothetical protein
MVPESEIVGAAMNENGIWVRVVRILLIIGFGLVGSLFLLMAFILFAEIMEEVSIREHDIRETEILITGSVALIFTIIWSFFLARTFKKYDHPIIKIIIFGLLFLPAILHQLLLLISEPLEVWTFEYHMVELMKVLITAGFWYGLSIWLKITYPANLRLAENTL